MKRMIGVVVPCLMVVVLGSSARAQVGYPPARSPFLDVDDTHEITPFFGYYRAKRDPAHVAPQSGTMGGLQYEWRATGPVHLGGEFFTISSLRTPQNPAKAPDSRTLADVSEPLYAIDAFLALSLTGARSWHHVMPMVSAGLGLITNRQPADTGGFKFGTRFALPIGAGVRWVPRGGHMQLRADVKDLMYTIAYPESYYVVSSTTDTPILTAKIPRSRWTNNFAMTVGASFTFSH